MKEKNCIVDIDSKEYNINFLANKFFKFKFKVFINNEINKTVKYVLNKKGADYNFEINTHKVTITLGTSKIVSNYDLVIDGISIATNNLVNLFSKL
jgi:hypothetical protein